jgi:hypothetical protein
MISEVWKLKQQYGHVTNIYIDAANPEVPLSMIVTNTSDNSDID